MIRDILAAAGVNESQLSLELPENLPNLISTDSRTIQAEEWYLPLQGANLDGHHYIHKAIDKGCSGFFYSDSSKIPSNIPNHVVKIYVENTLSFYQKLAHEWRKSLNAKVIAITGSAGKTTAKNMLASILSKHAPTLWPKESHNNEIGVPKTICRLTSDHSYLILEMGARHIGDIDFLCKMADPDICVLLNIGTAHIGEFGGADNLRKTKQEMFTSTRPNSIAIYLAQDSITQAVAKDTHDKSISFGIDQGDIAVKVNSKGEGSIDLDFFESNQHIFTAKCPTPNLAYPINFAAACAVSRVLGVTAETIKMGTERFEATERRFKEAKVNNFIIIDDSYNANPESMKLGIDSVSFAYSSHKVIYVLGSMLELGKSEAKYHHEIGNYLAKNTHPSYLVTVGPEARHISIGAQEAGLTQNKMAHYDKVEELIDEVGRIVDSGNLVYIKGSNSIGLNRFSDALFSELDK